MENDLIVYQNKLKENISLLIEKGKIEEAKELLIQYETIVNNDTDIISMMVVIAIIEGEIDYADQLIKNGLNIDKNNFDLLYNKGYVYQIKSDFENAKKFYKKALNQARNQNEVETVNNTLEVLSKIKKEIEETKRDNSKTSIIILTYNNLEYNKLCIDSIREHTVKGTYEIIVVDNHSTDGTVEWLEQQPDLKLVLNKENLGFPKGCNQGIQIADKGNDILLLNNDTIVTPRWLENLQECLYSNENIGAVGSVTNSCSNYQTIPVSYTDLEEMTEFASKHNISNPRLWEERLRLVGFCMLIKNEVVSKIGLLDEQFSPGNFEDDDYSYRIRKAGFRLMLCKDSFIHHFGSVSFGKESEKYTQLLINNRKKFAEKWKFDPYYLINIRKNITELLIKETTGEERILHLGCEGAGTLLDLKNCNPKLELFGIDPVKEAIVNTTHFAKIVNGNLDEIKSFQKEYFDIILITEEQSDLKNLTVLLNLLMKYINKKGKIFIALSRTDEEFNKGLVQRLKKEIGEFFFQVINTENELLLKIEMVAKENQVILQKMTKEELHTEDLSVIHNKNDLVKSVLRRIDININTEQNLAILKEILKENLVSAEEVSEVISKNMIDRIKVFNFIGVLYYQIDLPNKALMLLKEALKLNPENRDTVYNTAFILHGLNQNETALNMIRKIKNLEDDRELMELRYQIEGAL